MKNLLVLIFVIIWCQLLSQDSLNLTLEFNVLQNYQASLNANDPDNVYYQYSANNSNYSIEAIASDFGPRYLTYNWHGGIDFNGARGDGSDDMGDLLIAARGGTIEGNCFRGGNNFKYIAVDGNDEIDNVAVDFGYGHVFASRTNATQISGGCRLMRKSNNPTQWSVVVPRLNANGMMIGYRALSDIGGGSVIVQTNTTIDTLGCENQVEPGDIIGPVGKSIGGSGSVGAHLHFYAFNADDINLTDGHNFDPLQYLNFPPTEYHVEVPLDRDPLNTENPIEGILLNYGQNPTSIRVRPIAENWDVDDYYDDFIYDIASVSYEIKRVYCDNCEYDTLVGSNFLGYIDLGALQGHVPYPRQIIGDLISHRGTPIRTGIAPYAYYSDTWGYPFDDFYFSDFYHRINKNDQLADGNLELASTPDNLRYRDGKYTFRSSVMTTINQETELSDEIEFTLDNFKPYIQSIIARIAQTPVYNFHWASVDGHLEPRGGVVVPNQSILRAQLN